MKLSASQETGLHELDQVYAHDLCDFTLHQQDISALLVFKAGPGFVV